MRPLFLIIISTLLLVTSCRKHKNSPPPDNPYGLPNATQTGANLFACRVNGVNWVLQRKSSRFLGTNFLKSNNRDTFSFGAKGTPDSIVYYINFVINTHIQEGATYQLNDTTKAYAYVFRENADCGIISGYGGSQQGKSVDGSITISKFSGIYQVPACCTFGPYDATAIVAGTFNFNIAVPGCDTIKVTDGRFDVNYSNY